MNMMAQGMNLNGPYGTHLNTGSPVQHHDYSNMGYPTHPSHELHQAAFTGSEHDNTMPFGMYYGTGVTMNEQEEMEMAKLQATFAEHAKDMLPGQIQPDKSDFVNVMPFSMGPADDNVLAVVNEHGNFFQLPSMLPEDHGLLP
jgi:hypothetical protein